MSTPAEISATSLSMSMTQHKRHLRTTETARSAELYPDAPGEIVTPHDDKASYNITHIFDNFRFEGHGLSTAVLKNNLLPQTLETLANSPGFCALAIPLNFGYSREKAAEFRSKIDTCLRRAFPKSVALSVLVPTPALQPDPAKQYAMPWAFGITGLTAQDHRTITHYGLFLSEEVQFAIFDSHVHTSRFVGTAKDFSAKEGEEAFVLGALERGIRDTSSPLYRFLVQEFGSAVPLDDLLSSARVQLRVNLKRGGEKEIFWNFFIDSPYPFDEVMHRKWISAVQSTSFFQPFIGVSKPEYRFNCSTCKQRDHMSGQCDIRGLAAYRSSSDQDNTAIAAETAGEVDDQRHRYAARHNDEPSRNNPYFANDSPPYGGYSRGGSSYRGRGGRGGRRARGGFQKSLGGRHW